MSTEQEASCFSLFLKDVVSELCRIAPLDMCEWSVINPDDGGWTKAYIVHQIGVINDGTERKAYLKVWFREPYKGKQEALLSSKVDHIGDNRNYINLVNFLDHKYNWEKKEITFSTSRSSESIAKDIARKLINEHHVSQYKKAIARCQHDIDNARKTKEYLLSIAERLGLEPRHENRSGIAVVEQIHGCYKKRTTLIEGIKSCPNNTLFEVTLQQLTQEDLEQVVQFLEELNTKKKVTSNTSNK